MPNVLLMPALAAASLAAAAPQSTDRLPRAEPIPLDPSTGDAVVLAPIEAMFRALAAGDGPGVLAQVRPDGSATAVTDAGVRRFTWAEFASRLKPGNPSADERLTDPAVEVDGDIAMVWSPYQLRLAGRLHHCGTDHFDLIREAGRWRVLNVTWTQRPCAPVTP